jgi:hypothetical protein
MTPTRVLTICIPAGSVLVNPTLPHTGARSVVRSKSLFVAVGAAFGHSRLGFHWKQPSLCGLDLFQHTPNWILFTKFHLIPWHFR